MAETNWKKHDRQRPPCSNCGTLLYDKCWGNGGWVATEQATGKSHGPEDCVVMLKAQLVDSRRKAFEEVQAILVQPELWEERVRRALSLVTEYLTRPSAGT